MFGLDRARSAVLVLGLALGVVAEAVIALNVPDPPYLLLVLDAAIGYGYICAGMVASARAPQNRTGRLLVAVGFTWFIGNFRFAPSPIADVAILLRDVTNVALVWLLLAYPSGHLRSNLHRAAVAVVAVALIGPACLEAVAGTPAFTLMAVPSQHDQASLLAVLGIALALGLVVLLARRWLVASGLARRTLTPVIFGGTVTALAILSVQARQLVVLPPFEYELISWALLLARLLIPIGFVVGLLRLQMARSAVADLVLALADVPSVESLRPALAVALRDPTLQVFRWDLDADAYLDVHGRPTNVAASEERAVTVVRGSDHPLVAIVHDPALLEDPGLVASVASAMRLAVDNERLQLEVKNQLEEVRASRSRIVEAGDAERKRVERDLHDGAQQRLVSLALSLRLAQTKLGAETDPAIRASFEDASGQAKAALAELRQLARGIHPQVLTEAGLGPAIDSLADRSSVRVSVDVCPGRFSPAVEAAAYFTVSEALTNVAKYANARIATVRAHWSNNRLTVEVSDDGRGGADPAGGTGLRGLADRLSSMDGSLKITSPIGGGTRVLAFIPSKAPTGI